jgi:hypothetical protein
MKTAPLLWVLALVTGALITVQAAANAALSRSIQGNVDVRARPWISADSTARTELVQALADFRDAFAKADAAALDRLLADDYVHTNGGSGQVLDRAAWLGYVRSRRAELDSGILRIEEYRSSEPVIRLLGTVAVVTHEVTTAGERKGQRFRSRVQVTQMWSREGGRWRRAAFHDSPLETR